MESKHNLRGRTLKPEDCQGVGDYLQLPQMRISGAEYDFKAPISISSSITMSESALQMFLHSKIIWDTTHNFKLKGNPSSLKVEKRFLFYSQPSFF